MRSAECGVKERKQCEQGANLIRFFHSAFRTPHSALFGPLIQPPRSRQAVGILVQPGFYPAGAFFLEGGKVGPDAAQGGVLEPPGGHGGVGPQFGHLLFEDQPRGGLFARGRGRVGQERIGRPGPPPGDDRLHQAQPLVSRAAVREDVAQDQGLGGVEGVAVGRLRIAD